ncbi:GNAT family N-acetyltransferase [Acinetobacter gerneri]|uniref:N-acetyltransferase domain-containing protein n=1 Tax=Acinetobacter gerneri DSM 14967 = CIP 107464 = MTCC 9824 TaxID=1120926 RepID=N8ZK05_9GAMM|nr:GNAT family N-acetyltransferase [Acinetobacter gerneri]ENV32068.1 hypothetical protein F960_03453 [Acinetobacter gerneri DSM 14967 = CIP 107464 = MTCC 9824]EPR83632.1 putative acetyltransferase [Acinetobacter gerneri DSM 14967 = CIP 107464 = MTCC 9824]
MKIDLVAEFQLSQSEQYQIAGLLKNCFPEDDFQGRTYFKQRPHYRLLLKEEEKIIGQLALDYRVMTLGQIAIRVLGVIDIAILNDYQGLGWARRLLLELDQLVEKNKINIDFILLCTQTPKFYEKFGYYQVKFSQNIKWLAIDQHINYGIKIEQSGQGLMYKKIGEIDWNDDVLDMLGYWY